MTTSRLAKIIVAALLLVGFTSGPASAKPSPPDAADSIHTFARDVYVIVYSTLRNPDETTDPGAELFNVAGVNLGVTWGQWQAATASSLVQVKGTHTSGDIAFSGLVPNGVYSVFYGTLQPDSENPLCPNVERTLAFTSTDHHRSPDAASFVAGADGTAAFSGRVHADLLAAGQVFFSIVFHPFGDTWGDLPNHGESNTQGPDCRSSFGEDAMRQFLILQQW